LPDPVVGTQLDVKAIVVIEILREFFVQIVFRVIPTQLELEKSINDRRHQVPDEGLELLQQRRFAKSYKHQKTSETDALS
jgi:hypothetical protein